jgi:YD repeat-containing protein
LTGTAQSGWTAIETVSGIGAQPPAGFPSSFNVSAGASPTGSALTMTWQANIGDGLGGYTSNTSANVESGPSSGTAVWIMPGNTAGKWGGDSGNLDGSAWAFSVQDSSGDYLEGTYDTGVSPFGFSSSGTTTDSSGTISGSPTDVENIATNQTPEAYGRVSYTGSYYDAADRDIEDVNVGTNGGTPWSLPGTAPSTRSDSVLITTTAYNAAGEVDTVTDPRGIASKTYYDGLGRTTETIADYSDTTGSPIQQTVEYAYDGDNNMISETAVVPSSVNQTTAYNYGVSVSGGSGIDSEDLLG